MSQFAIDQVLSQIRALQATQRTVIAPPAVGAGPAPASGASGFAQVLRQGLEAVNATQQSADAKAAAFVRGTPGVELGDVMIEAQKASVALRATVEVRNRFVAAYQEIMNMPV